MALTTSRSISGPEPAAWERDRGTVAGDAHHLVEGHGADAHDDGFCFHDRDSTFAVLIGEYGKCRPALTTSRTSGTPGRYARCR